MSSQRKKPKRCPRMGKSCIEDECVFWVGYPAEKYNALSKTTVIETVYMCNDLWATKIAFDAARFADQAGASLDKLTNHVADGNAAIGSLVFEANRRLTDERDH